MGEEGFIRGMTPSHIKRIRGLEKENLALKKLLADKESGYSGDTDPPNPVILTPLPKWSSKIAWTKQELVFFWLSPLSSIRYEVWTV